MTFSKILTSGNDIVLIKTSVSIKEVVQATIKYLLHFIFTTIPNKSAHERTSQRNT